MYLVSALPKTTKEKSIAPSFKYKLTTHQGNNYDKILEKNLAISCIPYYLTISPPPFLGSNSYIGLGPCKHRVINGQKVAT